MYKNKVKQSNVQKNAHSKKKNSIGYGDSASVMNIAAGPHNCDKHLRLSLNRDSLRKGVQQCEQATVQGI